MPAFGRIIAQRVLPHEIAEPQVDMGAGRESGQVAATRIDEFIPVDGFGEISDRADAQLHGPGLPELFERHQTFCMFRPRDAWINQTGEPPWLYSFAALLQATMRPAAPLLR